MLARTKTAVDRRLAHVAARVAACLTLATACSLLFGCSATTVWRAKAVSPGGAYTAIAETVQNGGPGNAWVGTSVYLEQTNIPRTRAQVLAFSCEDPVPRPYTLDNKANAGGTIGLTMRWLTPTHLEVTYRSDRGATLNFQAVKYLRVAISLRDLSAGGPPQNNEHPPSRVH